MQPKDKANRSPMSLLDKLKHKLGDPVESGKRLSESTSDFAAAADAFHKFSPLLNFIDRYLPPLAIITSGFALIFEGLNVSLQRQIDRFITSKMGLGLVIVGAGILGLVFPVIAAAMFAVVVTAGLGKQIVEFVKHLNEDIERDPAMAIEKRLELAAGSIAWAGAMLLIIGGPFLPPLAIAGFGLLMLSIALPAAHKAWHWLHGAEEVNQFNTTQEINSELSHEHEYDSTARASFEIAEAESQEAHEATDESHVKHKAIEEIQHGLEHMEQEVQEVEPSPVFSESLVMPVHSPKPSQQEESDKKDDTDDSEGEGGKVSEDITPKM